MHCDQNSTAKWVISYNNPVGTFHIFPRIPHMVDPRPEALEISTEQLWDFRILRRCSQFHLFLGRLHSFHSLLSGLNLLLLLPSPSISNTEKGPKDSFRSIKLPSKSSSMGCKFLANVFIHMFSKF